MRYLNQKSKYEAHYNDLLIAHMSQGFSFESFGAEIGVGLYVITRWLEEFPEFAEAKAVGDSHSRKRWESIGIAAILGQIPNFNIGAYKLHIQNRFKGEYVDQAAMLKSGTVEEEVQKAMEEAKTDPVQFYLPDNGRRKADNTPPSQVIIDVTPDGQA